MTRRALFTKGSETWGDFLTPVAAGVVGVGHAEHVHQPGFPVAAVVGQGLARPLAGDEDRRPA